MNTFDAQNTLCRMLRNIEIQGVKPTPKQKSRLSSVKVLLEKARNSLDILNDSLEGNDYEAT
jgi:hypothetical protein